MGEHGIKLGRKTFLYLGYEDILYILDEIMMKMNELLDGLCEFRVLA